MNKRTPKTGYQIVESYNAQPFGIIEGFKTLAEMIEEELEARDAERDELKEAKKELLERLENLLAWAAFRSDWPAGEEPPEHDIAMARAAIAKHTKGE